MRSAIALAVAVPWVLWAALRTLGIELPYPLVAALAFTPYAALTSPLPVVLALVLRRWRIAALAGVASLGLVFAVLPRALPGPRPGADGPRLVVMTSNVWLGSADMPALVRIAQAHDVDVISLQEVRATTIRHLKPIDAFPQRVFATQLGNCALLSQLPMDVRSAGVVPEALLTVPGAPPVRIRAVHPSPPVSAGATAGWRAALRALPGTDARGDVSILAGDFNATLDHPELRAVLDRGWVDAGDAAGAGLHPSWPDRPRTRHTLPITIDHVLVDRRVRVERYSVVRIPHSDHRALIVVLRLPRA
jgi:endonuclease/exonuclease/phosphatase family metal-dependent hydrolase